MYPSIYLSLLLFSSSPRWFFISIFDSSSRNSSAVTLHVSSYIRYLGLYSWQYLYLQFAVAPHLGLKLLTCCIVCQPCFCMMISKDLWAILINDLFHGDITMVKLKNSSEIRRFFGALLISPTTRTKFPTEHS